MFYSKTTGGFYDTAIHGDNMPEDAVAINNVFYESLLQGQSMGKVISADASGHPVLVDPPKATAAQVWDEIKARRDNVKAGGVLVEGKWFHTDDASRIQHMALTMMGVGIPANLQWKTMDGSFITMSQALAGKIFQAVAAMDMQAFAAAETHRAALLAIATPSEYDFSAGWPQTYAEFVAAQE